MRQNCSLFKIGLVSCHLSLATFLVLPCLRSASAGPPPSASQLPSLEPDALSKTPPPADPHVAHLEQIWMDAWGLVFVPNQSGMTIYPIVADEWIVLVSDSGVEEDPIVDQGIFIESGPSPYEIDFSWDQDLLDEAGLLSVEHSYVRGTLYGSTGWEGQIDAMVTEVVAPGENRGDDPVLVQVLTPVVFAMAATGQEITSVKGDLTPEQCEAIWLLEREACVAKYHSDRRTCALITIGCFAGCAVICSASTFGYAICLAICLAGCLAYEAGCLNDANGDYDSCVAAADAKRMACEPGWLPPVAY